MAAAYDPDITGVQIPYSQMDCITFVQTVWRDIAAVSSSDVLCSPLGTNTLWRTNTAQYPNLVKTFNTTSPDNQNPTPVLWYKDDLQSCIVPEHLEEIRDILKFLVWGRCIVYLFQNLVSHG